MALMRASDFLDARKKVWGKSIFEEHAKCALCGEVLQETRTGCREMADGTFRCSDCYFDGLGDALERVPVPQPRVRRSL